MDDCAEMHDADRSAGDYQRQEGDQQKLRPVQDHGAYHLEGRFGLPSENITDPRHPQRRCVMV